MDTGGTLTGGKSNFPDLVLTLPCGVAELGRAGVEASGEATVVGLGREGGHASDDAISAVAVPACGVVLDCGLAVPCGVVIGDGVAVTGAIVPEPRS